MDELLGIADLDPNALFIASLGSTRQIVEENKANLHARINHLPLSEGNKEEIRKDLLDLFDENDLREMSARIYTAYYTPQELVSLAEFYRTPVGRKTFEVAPRIVSDVTDILTPRITEFLERLFKRLEALERDGEG